jgi:hypothetical protein
MTKMEAASHVPETVLARLATIGALARHAHRRAELERMSSTVRAIIAVTGSRLTANRQVTSKILSDLELNVDGLKEGFAARLGALGKTAPPATNLHPSPDSAAPQAGTGKESTNGPSGDTHNAVPRLFRPRMVWNSDVAAIREEVRRRSLRTPAYDMFPPPRKRPPLSQAEEMEHEEKFKALRAEVALRRDRVREKLFKGSERHLWLSRATVTHDSDGTYAIDTSGLFDDERRVFRDRVYGKRVQEFLARAWTVQEERKAAPSLSPPVEPALAPDDEEWLRQRRYIHEMNNGRKR